MISVIVPVYNVEQTINKCLDSIIVQSYRNLEIILVNDGSTDRSGEICFEYSTKDSRIVLINKKNGGLSSARNAALDVMKGDYVAFVDSDDWIEPTFLGTLYNDAQKYNCDIVIGYTFNIDQSGKKWRPYPASNCLLTEEEGLKCNIGIGYPCDDVVWNKLYKAKLFHTIRFPEGRIHEDTFIMARLMSMARRVYFDSSVSYYYLQRENSIIHNKESFGKSDIDKVDAYADVFSFIKSEFPEYVQLIGNKYVNCVITTLCRMNINNYSNAKEEHDRILNEYLEKRQYFKESYIQKFIIWMLKHNSRIPKIAIKLKLKRN